MKKNLIYFCFSFVPFLFLGCKKYVEVAAPSTSLTGSNVFQADATAISVMTGLYGFMSNGTFPFAAGINSISIQAGLSSDELALWGGNTNLNYLSQYQNTLNSQVYPPFWANLYYFLHTINSVIEGVNASTGLSPAIKRQLIGEAKFLRAFCHFYLVNLYGDIPLITTSNYHTNATLGRTAKDDVYGQIIKDLNDASEVLSPDYMSALLSSTTTERVRPNKWASLALLSRVYLYADSFDSAEAKASEVINYKTLYDTVPLASVFFKNNKEAIWQLQPVNAGWNTEDARVFMLSLAPIGINSSHPFFLSSFIVNSFEVNDKRQSVWTSSYKDATGTYNYPTKYKSAANGAPISEYANVIRLAELYLIRAEARAQKGDISGCISDVNVIRARAGLPMLSTSMSQASALSAVQHERQVELFTEWGHRWLDLKRTGNVDKVMNLVAPQKGTTWNSNWQLYPIPILDLQQDRNLTQNIGY